jgi:hypothetical protein
VPIQGELRSVAQNRLGPLPSALDEELGNRLAEHCRRLPEELILDGRQPETASAVTRPQPGHAAAAKPIRSENESSPSPRIEQTTAR